MDARCAVDANRRWRLAEAASREEDPSSQPPRNYTARPDPVRTRSTTFMPDVNVFMLRMVESVQQSEWRTKRELQNRDAIAYGATHTDYDTWTGNPGAPYPPLVSTSYTNNPSDKRCPNCFGCHPDPDKGGKTSWTSCNKPWDAVCQLKNDKYTARRKAKAYEGIPLLTRINSPQPDVALVIAVLRLLPPTIAEDIRNAQTLLATLEGDPDGRDPPLDELSAYIEDLHLWASEAARAVTSIAACFRGRATRNSMTSASKMSRGHAPGKTQPVTAPRHKLTAFEFADTFANPRAPRLAHPDQPLSARAERLVAEVTTTAISQRPVTRAWAKLEACAAAQASDGVFGRLRANPQSTVGSHGRAITHAPDDEFGLDDTSMEEYVSTMLCNTEAPPEPRPDRRTSGVPGPVRMGPRTRSASCDTTTTRSMANQDSADHSRVPTQQATGSIKSQHGAAATYLGGV